MSKKIPMKKAVNEEAVKEKDYITNKLLSVFTLAFILIFALLFIGRRMRRADMYYTMVFKSMSIVAICFAVIMVAGIIYAIVCKSKGRDMRLRLFSGVNIAVVSGFIALCFAALAISYTQETLKFLYIIIPAVTVLYIIYHSYQKEFFVLSATAGLGAIGMWLVCRALNGGPGQSKYLLLAITMYVLLALVVVFTALCQAHGGMLGKFHIFGEHAKYWTVYLAAFLVAAAVTLALILGGGLIYYYVFGLIGYVVLTGIFFTIKLI